MSTRATKLWSGVIVTVVIVAALVIFAFVQGQANKTTTNRGQVPPGMNEDPAVRAAALGMRQVDAATAASATVQHAVLSASDLPEETLASTWVSANREEVLEVYESGLTVLTENPEIGTDPLKYYEAVVAEAARPSVYLTEVNGVPALAVEPNTDKLGTNPGLVRFQFRGFSVVVSGRGMSVTYLSGVASRLHEVNAAGPSS